MQVSRGGGGVGFLAVGEEKQQSLGAPSVWENLTTNFQLESDT